MIKTITKIGNSSGIILDAALLEMLQVRAGDQVNLRVDSGNLVVTPIKRVAPDAEVASVLRGVLHDYKTTLGRLA